MYKLFVLGSWIINKFILTALVILIFSALEMIVPNESEASCRCACVNGVKKIPCTIEMINHYIPDQVCSKATLSNIISEALKKGMLHKEECSQDKRIKKITPSKELLDGWIKLKKVFEKDLGF